MPHFQIRVIAAQSTLRKQRRSIGSCLTEAPFARLEKHMREARVERHGCYRTAVWSGGGRRDA